MNFEKFGTDVPSGPENFDPSIIAEVLKKLEEKQPIGVTSDHYEQEEPLSAESPMRVAQELQQMGYDLGLSVVEDPDGKMAILVSANKVKELGLEKTLREAYGDDAVRVWGKRITIDTKEAEEFKVKQSSLQEETALGSDAVAA